MTAGTETRILLVEDAPETARLVAAQLTAAGFAVQHAPDGLSALRALTDSAFDAVLLDLCLPDIDGLQVLKAMSDRDLQIPVIVLTGNTSVDSAVKAIRAGAADYLVKPCDAPRLEVTLRNALERRALISLVASYRQRSEAAERCGFIGSSPAMQAVYRTIEAAAASRATIFVTGESGTGKELCAVAIHKLSPRRAGPFTALNCAAIPANLMESEIFGHTKGAFTGATAAREGAAARTDGGTLFLDEICDMPLELQAKLLRLVQTGTFRRLGSDRTEKADLRFICASNRDPVREVSEGRFREDLYYRMHVIPIELPPLRERGDDVLMIASYFLTLYAKEERKAFARFATEVEHIMFAYSWPGNVRELQNLIRRVVVLHDGEVVTPEMLPPPLRNPALSRVAAHRVLHAPAAALPETRGSGKSDVRPLRSVETDAIEQAIARCGGNVRRAASLLGVAPSTIYRKLRRAGQSARDRSGRGGAAATGTG
ncbi:MAG: sigma-54 dependent transcriptional regulator [Alphaproteobacteria bacterium]